MPLELAELGRLLRENELKEYQVFLKERRVSFNLDNEHALTIEIEGHPGTHLEWEEDVVVKFDGILIARV